MKNKVYYGEYSLKHWIELIISNNLVLPDYQRHFVWRIRDVKRLIKTLKEKQFIQPVTIALYNIDGERKNLIIDGQQRLTSVLLAYLGYFPNSKNFTDDDEKLANEDDSAVDFNLSSADFDIDDRDSVSNYDSGDMICDDNPISKPPLLWRFEMLLGDKNTKENIINRIHKSGKYIPLKGDDFNNLDDSFFENNYIGFSYIVPESSNKEDVQICFSKMFRNINYLGRKLDYLESRRSLYYQNSTLIKYFEGSTSDGSDVLCNLTITDNFQPSKIDFVRYLSLLSQYIGSGCRVKNVLLKYSALGSRESFYSDYVSFVLGQGIDEQESCPTKFNGFVFSDIFPDNCWLQRFDSLKEAIEKLKPSMGLGTKESFASWMEADYWLFGLIYHILFKNKKLNDRLIRIKGKSGGSTMLQVEISKKIALRKKNAGYLRNTNRVGLIRERLEESCNIYSYYVH